MGGKGQGDLKKGEIVDQQCACVVYKQKPLKAPDSMKHIIFVSMVKRCILRDK